MVKVRIKLDKDVLKREIEQLRQDVHTTASGLAAKWSELVQRAYLQGGYPIHWKPLARRTIRDKLSQGYPLDPLIRTGKMQASNVFRVSRSTKMVTITAFNKRRYWKFHETGTRYMPARPQVNPALYEKEFAQYIEQKLGAKAV